jgi:saccharopine dehydrogenase (NAD+, L-lysine-forming)
VEPDEYLERDFSYPVYTQLKGSELYARKETGKYSRADFHAHPSDYYSRFRPYAYESDILMNGVYWDKSSPRLFEKELVGDPRFRIKTIADITDDPDGSVPINLGDQEIGDPIYGVDRLTFQKTAPYLPGSVDIMAVGNLPNELPRDASRYFGEQLIKFVLPELAGGEGNVIPRATMVSAGRLTEPFQFLRSYAGLS